MECCLRFGSAKMLFTAPGTARTAMLRSARMRIFPRLFLLAGRVVVSFLLRS